MEPALIQRLEFHHHTLSAAERTVVHRAMAVVRESADLIYQLVVLWRECGIDPEEVWGEMRRRADRFGIAEKPPKPCAGNPASSTTPAEGAS